MSTVVISGTQWGDEGKGKIVDYLAAQADTVVRFQGGSNVIIGGSGVSTLWGYYGNSADTLIGGTGPEIFRAGRFEGNDVIYTHEGHDVISLYDTNLSDITSANVVGDLISINFNSGNTLSLHNTAEVTSVFQLANGERYNYNRSTQQWQGA